MLDDVNSKESINTATKLQNQDTVKSTDTNTGSLTDDKSNNGAMTDASANAESEDKTSVDKGQKKIPESRKK